MKRNLTVLFSLFACACFTPLRSQVLSDMDSLWNVLPQQQDTAAISTMLQLAKYHTLFGPEVDSVEIYAQEALVQSRRHRYFVGEERALFCLGHAFSLRQEYEASNDYFRQAMELMDETDGKRGIAATLNNIGKNHMMASDYEQAHDYFLQSLRIEEEIGQTGQLYASFNNIAIVQSYLGQHEKALENRLKAYRGHRRLGDKYSEAQSLINLVVDFNALDEPDSALHYARIALDICEEIGMKEGIIRAGNHLALLSLKKKQYQDVIRYSNKTIEMADSAYHTTSLSHAYRLLGAAYDSLNNKNRALHYSLMGLYFSQQANTSPELLNSYNQLYELHKNHGRYDEALKFKEAYHVLKDSIFTVEREAKITELQAKYDQEKDKLALAEQAAQLRIQTAELREKNILIFSLVIGVLLLALIFFLYNRQQVLKEKQQTLEARQRLLRTQINPHFLFNALSSIQQVIYEKEDRKTAALYLTKFAKLMRLILENSRESYIPLEQEIDTLRFYLELQKMRFRDSFDYEIHIDEEIDPEEVMIPPMFAQPFIENSLEHGILHKSARGKIRLAFLKTGDMLEFIVEDNGVGREQAAFLRKNRQHRSLATEITRDRLSLLSMEVKKRIDLKITDQVDDSKQITGTKVTFSLPLMYG